MGKMIFNSLQKSVFEKIAKENYFQKNFYLSGGTALSVFYLYHRYSFDLDFFSPNKLDYYLIMEPFIGE